MRYLDPREGCDDEGKRQLPVRHFRVVSFPNERGVVRRAVASETPVRVQLVDQRDQRVGEARTMILGDGEWKTVIFEH